VAHCRHQVQGSLSLLLLIEAKCCKSYPHPNGQSDFGMASKVILPMTL